ncbi:MAG: mevalonate kinase [Bacteroidia bacterium]
MIKESLYYAKILLFGEYGIIEDAMGLSIPYNQYQGQFSFTQSEGVQAKKSNAHLQEFLNYLRALQASGDLPAALNLERFAADIAGGMHFDSSIPQGFGIGSSGALVAAVYDRYAEQKIEPSEQLNQEQIAELKRVFGQLEAHFHGRSSGMDPLICYLRIPILINNKTDLGTVSLPAEKAGQGAIFLLNTGEPGETQPLVNLFLERLKHEGFRNMIRTEFKKYNDECIKSFLQGDVKPLFRNLRKLSQLALDNFKPMIPDLFHTLWKQGIDSRAYYLKLCGSGGGGYILGFTQNYEKASKMLKDYELEVIYRF